MLTAAVEDILSEARRQAWDEGQESLSLPALAAAVVRHPEGGVLLGRSLGLPLAKVRAAFPPRPPAATMVASSLPLDEAARAVFDQAFELAGLFPDLVHPGWVAVRHLALGLCLSLEACSLLGAGPIAREDALSKLGEWREQEARIPGLGELAEALRTLRSSLLARVFGQDHAVHAFVEGLFNAEVVAQADVQRKRPRAIFAFAGPPGVGKTFLAELGAENLGRPFQRFDMSAYSDHQAYMALVGFPPSFQAAKEGLLTGFVARDPTAFLLFDEIEKAHLTTLNLFLQILDAGRLEDKFTSQEVSFRDTIIIFTTNAGASLYDRPNETGIHAANASFHRQTILDALRTEKGPGGQPTFPAAICSRLATGYPVLFNHLGVNELERIARTEVDRVIGLLQQQYYKAITYDECLPLALVLREGAAVDARTVRSQSGIFVQTELFRFTDMFTRRRLDHVWATAESIHFGLDPGEGAGEADALFEPPEKVKVLLVALPELCELYRKNLQGVEWVTASSAQDAMQALAATEVDMVLLDIWLGRSPESLTLAGTVGQFDYAPLGARALAEGQQVLEHIHTRLAGLPVHLLSIAAEPGGQGRVDENLLLACVRSGGARALLASAFTGDDLVGWEETRDEFAAELYRVALHTVREKKARELGQQHKVLAFEAVPAVRPDLSAIDVRLRNLRLSRAVSAEDAQEVLSEVERPSVRFADVFGADSAKEALQFVVEWLHNPRQYAALGVRPPRGILLTGSPGTGKTMLARALAGEADVAFLVASGTDFVTIWQGSGPQNVRDLFNRARRYAPAIVFIDEIDAIGQKRMGAGGAGRAEESTLNALLTEMDGFGAPTLRPVIVLAATNLGQHLDEALRRRFGREIEVPPPDRAARAAYLRHELLGRKTSQVSEALIDTLAGRSAGMTIANLRGIVNEAAVMAARARSGLTDQIVEEAFEKVRMGEARSTPDPQTLARIARHESGHALVGWLTGNRPVQVTIVGRGSAGGYVEREATEDKIIYTRGELEDLICGAMAGRAAELLYYGEAGGLSTGVAGDLRNASAWAQRMVGEYGMSDEVGQICFDPRPVLDGPLAVRVTQAAERIVRAQLDRALGLLKERQPALDRLAAELLAKNRLTRDDLERILAGVQPVACEEEVPPTR